MQSIVRAKHHAQQLQSIYPWTKAPLVVGAPMRVLSGPELAVKVSEAGGLGFIGPGTKPEQLRETLQQSRDLLKSSSLYSISNASGKAILPIGVGFQTWAGDLKIATEALSTTHVAAIWLFAPRHGQQELDEWTESIRAATPDSQIWIQVASVKDAVAAATSRHRPDVLVIQGSDAGGHSLKRGAGIITLLPEVADAIETASGAGEVERIPLIAAGGISDARGAAAALTLSASGVAIGTRLLTSTEATINPGYQKHILSAGDGGQTTVRTQLYNHLRGTTDWPEEFDARGLVNQSWRDHENGVDFEEIKELHDEVLKKGEEAWGEKGGRTATYVGTGVGLIKEVKSAREIVEEMRGGVTEVLVKAHETIQ